MWCVECRVRSTDYANINISDANNTAYGIIFDSQSDFNRVRIEHSTLGIRSINAITK